MKTLLDSMCTGQLIGNITKCKSKLYQEMPIWNMFRSLLSRSPPHKSQLQDTDKSEWLLRYDRFRMIGNL